MRQGATGPFISLICGSPGFFIASRVPAWDVDQSLGDSQVELRGDDDNRHYCPLFSLIETAFTDTLTFIQSKDFFHTIS